MKTCPVQPGSWNHMLAEVRAVTPQMDFGHRLSFHTCVTFVKPALRLVEPDRGHRPVTVVTNSVTRSPGGGRCLLHTPGGGRCLLHTLGQGAVYCILMVGALFAAYSWWWSLFTAYSWWGCCLLHTHGGGAVYCILMVRALSTAYSWWGRCFTAYSWWGRCSLLKLEKEGGGHCLVYCILRGRGVVYCTVYVLCTSGLENHQSSLCAHV